MKYKMTSLYTLSEVAGPIRYVGKTVKPLLVRLQQHLSDARRGIRNRRCNWLRSINAANVEIDLIADVEGSGATEEIRLIADLRALGLALVNGTDGGEGALGRKQSEKTRAKIGGALLGRKHSPDARANMSRALRGNTHTRGYVHTVKARANMSAAMIGNTNALGKNIAQKPALRRA